MSFDSKIKYFHSLDSVTRHHAIVGLAMLQQCQRIEVN
jgi:hypothetical protein